MGAEVDQKTHTTRNTEVHVASEVPVHPLTGKSEQNSDSDVTGHVTRIVAMGFVAFSDEEQKAGASRQARAGNRAALFGLLFGTYLPKEPVMTHCPKQTKGVLQFN